VKKVIKLSKLIAFASLLMNSYSAYAQQKQDQIFQKGNKAASAHVNGDAWANQLVAVDATFNVQVLNASIAPKASRINTISPGIIITPLAKDELTGPRGDGYRRMIEISAAGRAGTPDEVGTVGALLTGPDGAFITGSDFLMDGGVTAAYWYGELALKSE
jgi:hypothetical protein